MIRLVLSFAVSKIKKCFASFVGCLKLFLPKISNNEINIGIALFVISAFAVILYSILIDFYSSENVIENLLSEAHGILFDLLILVILFSWLKKRGERKQEIERYLDEIDDFRGWNSQEAAHRLRGIIRRLNQNKYYQLDLWNCFLEGADLRDSQFHNSRLLNAKLNNSYLHSTVFEKSNLNGILLNNANLINVRIGNCELHGAQLNNANLWRAAIITSDFKQANLESARLNEADLQDVNFQGTNLMNADLSAVRTQNVCFWLANMEGAILRFAKFNGASFVRAVLRNADFKDCDLTNADFSYADFRGARNLTAEQLAAAKSLKEANLDNDMKTSLSAYLPNWHQSTQCG